MGDAIGRGPEVSPPRKVVISGSTSTLVAIHSIPGSRFLPMSSRYVDTHRFRKNRTHISSTFSRLHKNTLWKGKSASDENIHMRDILIFPVVSFVNFFFRFFFLPNKYYGLSRM